MKRDFRIKFYGEGEKGNILFFLDRQKYHHYYRSIIYALANRGYLVIAIPYHIRGLKEKLNQLIAQSGFDVKDVYLMSHGRGDETVYWFQRVTDLNVKKIIISSPSRNVIHYKDTETLVLWANKYKPSIANGMYSFAQNRKNYHFIGYPNVSKYLFAGVGYSQYHDRYDKKPKKTFFDADKYSHIEEDVLEDITLFLNKGEIKEKLAIFCENYLPFTSGVNILTNVLKVELEKQGKKVYPVTYALKGVDYCAYTQDKNVIIFPCLTMPGKKSATEALMMSPFPRHNMRVVSAYQFTYIQLQTEFTMGLVGLYLRKKYNIPMVYTSHTMWNDMMEKRYSKFVAKIINFVINHFMLVPPLKYSDLMTVPTHKVKDYYMNKWHKGEPIVVLPGCVDGNNFAMNDEDYEKLEKLRETFQLKDKIVLGYIGRVSKEKSIDVVLDYFEKCAEENHNLVLMIVGDGPYFKQINERCRYSKFNERIFFTGGVPNNTLKYYYRLFNVFCTASTFETQGLTYIESMWCHVPILAKDDRCLDHFLISGVNGVTFSDYDSWRVGLYKLTTDEIFTKHIVDEGYKTAKTYAKDIYAKRMYFLYNQARKFINKEIDEVDYDAFNAIK